MLIINNITENIKDYIVKTAIKYKKYSIAMKFFNRKNYIDSGIARDVYFLSKNIVVKIERSNTCQSLAEIQFYKDHYKKFKRFMCPMYGYTVINNSLMLFMQRVKPLHEDILIHIDKNNLHKIYTQMKQFERETGLLDSLENHGNWGILNNKLVALDCGINQYNKAYYCYS
jgi:hypothetical protein